jgi:prophage regulatory protein
MTRMLSWKQVHELVLYSRSDIKRQEEAKTFPKRVRLGPNRIGWVEREVLAWLKKRIEERDNPTDDNSQ